MGRFFSLSVAGPEQHLSPESYMCDSIMGCETVSDRRRVEHAGAGLATFPLMTSVSATRLLCGLTTPFAQLLDIKRCGAFWQAGGCDGGAAWCTLLPKCKTSL